MTLTSANDAEKPVYQRSDDLMLRVVRLDCFGDESVRSWTFPTDLCLGAISLLRLPSAYKHIC